MSKMEAPKIEKLRREFQHRSAGQPSQEHCPDAETLWDAAAGELPVEERREVVSHLCGCDDCGYAWRLAWAMQAEMRDARKSSDTYTTVVIRKWKRFAPQVAAAAMLVLALGVGIMWHQPEAGPESPTPVHRGAAPEYQIESLIPEDEALPREEFVLEWTPGPKGSAYSIRVLHGWRELAEAEDLEEPVFEVSEENLAGIPTSGEITWYVQTFRDGKELDQASFVTAIK